MKNLLFLLFFFGITLPTFCQNWNAVPLDNINNYRTPLGELIQQSVWVDSLIESEGSLISHFNKIAEINSNSDLNSQWDTMIINKNHFLSNKIRESSDSLVFYYETDTLVLLKNAPLDELWLADAANNSYCSIIREEEIDILGFTDSIKVFQLAESEDSLVLSKNFGVTEFSLPYDTLSYTLAGVDNLDLGETVIGFEEIFDFTVGDVLFYRNVSCSYTGEIEPCDKDDYEKLTVLNVNHSESIVTVEFQFLVRREYDLAVPDYYNYIASRTYSKNDQSHFSSFPNQLVALDGLDAGSLCGSDSLYTVVDYFIDADGKKTKGITNNVENLNAFDYVFCTLTGDTLFAENQLESLFYETKEGLGITAFGLAIGEVADYRRLVGYIHDGIEYGTVYPDSYLSSTVNEKKLPLRIYPNPTTDIINIESQDLIGSQLNISSVEGIIVQQFEITDNNLVKSVKDLPKGVYYISISRDAKTYQRPIKIVKY